MKATLEFNLDDHDDKLALLRCVKATNMAIALFEIEMNLKKRCEFALDADDNMNKYEALELIFEKLYDTIHESGINIEELIN